ncbi:hypothetical protein PENTCL1PPCAC_25917, partial [Pristionchus entomophagus]
MEGGTEAKEYHMKTTSECRRRGGACREETAMIYHRLSIYDLPARLHGSDDLEDGGSADDENEEADEPRRGGIFGALGLLQQRTFSALDDVLVEGVVGDVHTLLGGHDSRVSKS